MSCWRLVTKVESRRVASLKKGLVMDAFAPPSNGRSIRKTLAVLSCMAAVSAAGALQAHHSYAMFDSSATRTVSGTVAELEWKNPHVFVWVYVPKPNSTGAYDLWAFENGSPSVLSVRGWRRDALMPGEKITVEYWPLRSGRNGGHFERATLSGGRTLVGAGGPGRF